VGVGRPRRGGVPRAAVLVLVVLAAEHAGRGQDAEDGETAHPHRHGALGITDLQNIEESIKVTDWNGTQDSKIFEHFPTLRI
jgi:hypothetical protein